MMNRRDVVRAAATGALTMLIPRALNGEPAENRRKSSLGVVVYCCLIRRQQQKQRRADADLFAPLHFLEHCVKLGAGGMQIPLGVLDAETALALRKRAEAAGMYIEAIVGAPQGKAAVDLFAAQIKTAADVGARAARMVIMPGRRYEFFQSLAQYREAEARGEAALERAARVAEKHRIALAVENHKDQRTTQRVALFERISSEYVGACVDTGNSFSLLEDPIATVESLAPWAHSVHLKDQAVQPCDDGFLLADIPLGQGFLDLPRIVAILKRARPDVRFTLELITRDPLKVPCLTDKYWTTFPTVSGKELARTLRTVRDGASRRLQYPSKLKPEEKLALEDTNISASFAYGRDHLGL